MVKSKLFFHYFLVHNRLYLVYDRLNLGSQTSTFLFSSFLHTRSFRIDLKQFLKDYLVNDRFVLATFLYTPNLYGVFFFQDHLYLVDDLNNQ